MADTQDNEQHKKAMQAQQKTVRAAVKNASEERGIVLFLYGDGKGKSSSAFGTLLRAVGHGQTASVVQFIKGSWKTGEHLFFADHPQVTYHVMGTGFTWDTQDRAKDTEAAQAVWQQGKAALADPNVDLVLLDEITYMFDFGYLSLEECLQALRARPPEQNVILTGRTGVPELIELADTVSEIRAVKHAFDAGVRAQKGIEY